MRPGAVLITGAASGVGRATAALAAQEGHDLLLLDRDEIGLVSLQSELSSEADDLRVVSRPCDVTDGDGLKVAVDETKGQRSPLSGVVSCAGIEVLGDVESLSPEAWGNCLAST